MLSDETTSSLIEELLECDDEGVAKVTFRSGNFYIGRVLDGDINGKGEYTWLDGVVYTGDFLHNKITGSGSYLWIDGSTYSGNLLDGYRDEQGTFTTPNGEELAGFWKDGKPDGKGICKYANGATYDGYWKNGMKHGVGLMLYSSGNYYEGGWKGNIKQGFGNWAANYPNGYGVYTWQNRLKWNRYEGNWMNGCRDGFGIFYYSNGSKYEGNWLNNLKYITNNGRLYNGQLEADRTIVHFKSFDNSTPHFFHLPPQFNTEREQIAVNAVFFRHFEELQEIYARYEGVDGSHHMTRLDLWELLLIAKLPANGLSLCAVDRSYSKYFKDDRGAPERYSEPHNPSTIINYHDFLEYLLICAYEIFRSEYSQLVCDDTSIPSCLLHLLKSYILVTTNDPVNRLKFDMEELVLKVEMQNKDKMERMFNELARKNCASLPDTTNDKTLTCRDLILMLKSYHFFENDITAGDLIAQLVLLFPSMQFESSTCLDYESLSVASILVQAPLISNFQNESALKDTAIQSHDYLAVKEILEEGSLTSAADARQVNFSLGILRDGLDQFYFMLFTRHQEYIDRRRMAQASLYRKAHFEVVKDAINSAIQRFAPKSSSRVLSI